MAYVSKKRTNPEFTFEMAGALKLNIDSDEVGPTNGGE
jgi:hypothetical protein